MSERILCPAIWYKLGECPEDGPVNLSQGYVLCGYRHNEIMLLNFHLTGKKTTLETSEPGFLTSNNRFVDRIEAMEVAIAAGQVDKKAAGAKLTSEQMH